MVSNYYFPRGYLFLKKAHFDLIKKYSFYFFDRLFYYLLNQLKDHCRYYNLQILSNYYLHLFQFAHFQIYQM
nr:MAG TPA: hypothetical protein [Caudoviricetes sp.]